jgi:tRNA-Thr(GGU) m(6)t(6)A37 methyltransferase TsaA
LELNPIGTIHTPFKTKEECPIQPVYAKETAGRVDVFPEFAPGLKDIDTFSHIYLLYAFDRAGRIEFVRATFLDDAPHGIYASRHPCRPNSIGMSIVELIDIQGTTLIVQGIDVLDDTPLLDIKPYIPKFDCFPEASEGWTADKAWREKPPRRE